MQVKFTGLVREVRRIEKNKAGDPLSNPFEVVSFVDTENGGDLKLNYGLGECPYKQGQTITFDGAVRGQLSGYNIGLWAVSNGKVPAK